MDDDETLANARRRLLDANAELETNSFDAGLWLQKGLAHIDLEEFSEGLDAVERAVELDPVNPIAWSILGTALRRLKRFADARNALESSLSLNERASTYVILGDVHEQMGAGEEAIDAYERAIEMEPNFKEAYLKMAYLIRPEDPHGAAKLLETAIELDPNYGDAIAELGAICLGFGELERSETLLRRGLELNGHSLWSHLYLGNLLWQLGRNEEAEIEFKAACLLDESAFSLTQLAKLYLGNDRQDDAMRVLEAASKKASKAQTLGGQAYNIGASRRRGGPPRDAEISLTHVPK